MHEGWVKNLASIRFRAFRTVKQLEKPPDPERCQLSIVLANDVLVSSKTIKEYYSILWYILF